MTKFATRFIKDESGATACEYAVIAALIHVAIIAGVSSVGTKLGSTFNTIGNNVSSST